MIGVIIISSKMFAQTTVEISEFSVTRNTKLTIFAKLERKSEIMTAYKSSKINILLSNQKIVDHFSHTK
jgi:hypothetical protein